MKPKFIPRLALVLSARRLGRRAGEETSEAVIQKIFDELPVP